MLHQGMSGPLGLGFARAASQDPDSIERVLQAMGLPFDVPELAPARAPPGGEQEWFGA